MKIHCRVAAVIACLLATGLRGAAVQSFELATKLYVFRAGSFRSIEVDGDPVAEGGKPVVFGSADTLRFGREALSLKGRRVQWNSGQDLPKGFATIGTPLAFTRPGEPVTLLASVPTQYLEKSSDGSLQVRQIPGDSPEAPRYQLTFTIDLPREGEAGLPLTCEIDLAMVARREPVAGLTLEVGKPTLTRYHEKIATAVRPGEWAGFLIPAVNGTEFGLLGLMKVQVEGETSGLMTADEFHTFATFYYRNPQPDLVALAIESLGPSGFVPRDSKGHGCVGFFAEVFAANPTRVEGWRKLIDRQDAFTRELLRRSLKLSRPGRILALDNHSPADNEIFWGAFFASGNPAFVRKVAEQLEYLDGGFSWRPGYVPAGSNALLSLAGNLPEHPLARATLEEVQAEANPRTREWIERILKNDMKTLYRELRAFLDSINSPAFTYPSSTGPRDIGDFGPMNPNQESSMRRQ